MRIVVVSDRACMRRALLDRLRDEPLIAVAGQAATANEAVVTARLCRAGAVVVDAGLSIESADFVLSRLAERGFCGQALVVARDSDEGPRAAAKHRAAISAGSRSCRRYSVDRELEHLVADLRMVALDLRLPQGLAHTPMASRAA